ncbi:MAG: hypothetical protein EXR08_09795 [Alphaproteobacteria bacterium]|nr:hypothetical protein [Alphaproteobacteria bacterium]
MSLDPASASPPAAYTGRYYALPLRGRLTPYEGGSFEHVSNTGAPDTPNASAKSSASSNAKNGFSFVGLLDILNPQQHIPILSSLYRRLTGDEITPVGRVAGDTLYLGVIGLAASVANLALAKTTGKDAGDHVMTAMLGDKDKAPDPGQDIAGNTPDPGAVHALAAVPHPDGLHGRVTVHPMGGIAAQPLDAATLDALARTMGSYVPLAGLMPPESNNVSNNVKEKPGSPADTGQPDRLSPGAAVPGQAAASYKDAPLRMQHGLDKYQGQNR